MKKVIALAIALVMVVGCVSLSFAKDSSPVTPHWTGGGSSASSSVNASTTVKTGGVEGTWTKDAAGKWSFNDGTKTYKSTWALIKNPAAKGASQWFYFDQDGNLVTGWVWIKGADGVTRCYYLCPSGDSMGACYMNGKTPDGYFVNANGEWIVNGVVQTK